MFEHINQVISQALSGLRDYQNQQSYYLNVLNSNQDNAIASHLKSLLDGGLNLSNFTSYDELIKAIESGDYRTQQGLVGSLYQWLDSQPGVSTTGVPDYITKFLDNMIANQNTIEARNYETGMRDSSLLSAGDQLSQLGLSPSGVLQTGGLSSNGVAAADNSFKGETNQFDRAMAKYNQRMALAKQVLSMTSSMASAGIYGHAIGQARKAASVLTSAASHSGLNALAKQGKNERLVNQLFADGNYYMLNKIFGK